MSAAGFVGDSPIFLIDYALRLLRVLVLLSIWRVILSGQSVPGAPLEAILTYTLISEVLGEPLSARTELAWTLREGSIITRYLQPLGLVGQYAAEAAGRWLVGLVLFAVPLFLAAPILGVDPLPASASAFAWFLPSFLLAVSAGLALEFLFGALMIYFEQSIYGVDRMRSAITTLLSGAVIPLALLPSGLGDLFQWLPFAAMASAPLRIYTGTGDPVLLLVVQAGWSVVLWPAALWLWQANREKLVSLGG